MDKLNSPGTKSRDLEIKNISSEQANQDLK